MGFFFFLAREKGRATFCNVINATAVQNQESLIGYFPSVGKVESRFGSWVRSHWLSALPFQKFSNRHRLETLEKQIHIDDSVSEGLLIHFSVFQAAVVIIMAVTNLL